MSRYKFGCYSSRSPIDHFSGYLQEQSTHLTTKRDHERGLFQSALIVIKRWILIDLFFFLYTCMYIILLKVVNLNVVIVF